MARIQHRSYARVSALCATMGLAVSVHAQTNNSVMRFEVRPQGAPASAWTTDLSVSPGSAVEVRALVTYVGSVPAVGLANATFQPTVSNWNVATDTLRPFVGTGTNPSDGGVIADSGGYGRILPFAFTVVQAQHTLRGHTNNVAGVNYLRIAQNNTTNWVGVGPTCGTAASNNYIGSHGIPCLQKPSRLVTVSDPVFLEDTTDVEVFRFAIGVDGDAYREMVVDAPQLGIRYATGIRQFSWFSSRNDFIGNVFGTVSVQTAMIRVPAPGAMGILGALGAFACRRRR